MGMWGLYTCFWGYMMSRDSNHVSAILIFTVFLLVMQLITVYTNVYLLIPRFLTTRKYTLYFMLLFGLFMLIGFTIYQFLNQNVLDTRVFKKFEERGGGDLYFFSIFITVFSTSLPTLILILYEKLKAENEAKQLEKEKVETELKFLRAQINPHFLFNAINSIFNLIDKDTDHAKDLLVKFSDMLRYHLYETHHDVVSLATELEYIRSYADMEKLRKGTNLEVSLNIDEAIPFIEVPPLVLLSFAENAFKHVSNYHNKENRVSISITKKDQELHFNVSNSKENLKTELNGSNKGGIGLENIKRRLELLYAHEHDLSIREDEDHFEVDLKLNLQRKETNEMHYSR